MQLLKLYDTPSVAL